jgi:polysaccharide export outer membrane protein
MLLFLLLVAAPLLSGCATPQPQIDAAFEAPYTLDSGDRLRLTVFGQESLSNTYSVDAAGKIAVPLIGSVEARGRTTEELARAVSARLRQGYLREPHVAVEIETYRPFFVLGEVTAAGQYAYVSGMTVETAVAIAGGFSPRARKSTAEISRVVNGQVVRATVPTSYPVRPGDTINIAERWL